ncbi:hypothetical protein AN394_04250 [Pseudoalteromonas sp. P1-26]|uniref:DUF5412 family protein n=1 Tax=Pseudoalteromonas sp. P1-26 TaxID=1723759 RepID=UPI0006D669A3|nr:DUF5412 family protein [Pseudoalteromonas sp. P1-26]KPZ63943.1 hypothetical protein AN394_04250 [Pseudoalteromonas sp. P1-26]
MDFIIKLIVRLGILAGVISTFFILWVYFTFPDMCGNYLHAEAYSPDNKNRIVVFQRDCGATTGFSAQISILGADVKLPNESANIFIIPGLPNEVAPGVEWLDNSTIKISHRLNGQEYLSETNYGWFNKVVVKYE